jgi:nucleotide-binding universal stress UspA family protein
MAHATSLLLHASAETADPGAGAAAYALAMAKALGAHLTAMSFQLDVVSPTRMYESPLLLEGRNAVHEHNQLVTEKADALRTAAAHLGVDADIRTERSYAHGVAHCVAHRARLVDWVIAAVGTDSLLNDRAVAEHLLFQSARPVIVVPANWSGTWACKRVLVAWDFSRNAARALSDALPLLQTAKEVRLVAFGDDKAFDNTTNSADVIQALARRGVTAQFQQAERGSARIGEALASAADAADADLLVMGAFGHSRFREFILGGATRHLLHNPALPTLMSH